MRNTLGQVNCPGVMHNTLQQVSSPGVMRNTVRQVIGPGVMQNTFRVEQVWLPDCPGQVKVLFGQVDILPHLPDRATQVSCGSPYNR
ncbi:Hypp3022 [Branchiostoma lanceolatum]|uniref:Hypp3022 protein n=1 Tax=Branchiostoma lanceolatum TaxID=7740 RepID=A0A8K0ESC8_BRALA|nr:Hypp3022 [Branchiostoma lanceolatum]